MNEPSLRRKIEAAIIEGRTPERFDLILAAAAVEHLILTEQRRVAEAAARWCAQHPDIREEAALVRDCLAALFPSV